MVDEIQKILEYAKNAPSGDNSQPWRFKILKNSLEIFVVPTADNPILNYNLRGSLIAHGAILENIFLSAAKHGFGVEMKLNNDYLQNNKIASLVFAKDTLSTNPLATAIPNRSTNRTKYSTRSLDRAEITDFQKLSVSPAEVKILNTPEKIQRLAENLSLAEYVFLRTQKLHKLLFDDLVWSKEEELQKKRGLYVATLELTPPALMVMRMARNWTLMRVFRKIGLPSVVASENARVYASSGAIGAIIVPNENTNFISAGRTLERIWLHATNIDMGLQPLNGIVFLGMSKKTLATVLSPEDKKVVEEGLRIIYEEFAVGHNKTIATVFRVGQIIKAPSAHSSKGELVDLMI